MKQIIFVDDDLLVLQGLRRMLHPMRKDWDMRFATSGAEALEMMAAQPADVVVSDMRMPNMNGAQLLNQLMQRYPKTVRFILSGYSDKEMIMQCVGGTHQFLSKPCDGETLQQAVTRALELDQYINNDSIKSLVSQLKTIPSLPSLYLEIIKELGSPDANLERAGATIAKDPAMTAKILQLTNSAFFGLPRRLANPTEAVIQLGLETIKSLVLAIHVFSEFEACEEIKPQIKKLHFHSLNTALMAKNIAEQEGQDKYMLGESFTAGLLHDIGRLVLIANLRERYAKAVSLSQTQGILMIEAERQVFGASHAEVGAYLLGLWGLPLPIVEAVLFHHFPHHCPPQAQNKNFTSLTAVHVANFFGDDQPVPLQSFLTRLDRPYLTRVGCWERVPAWWKTLNDR